MKIARLIKAGHQWQDIQEYSFGQFQIFLKAANQLEAQYQSKQIKALRLAAWGKGDQVEKIIKDLDSLG